MMASDIPARDAARPNQKGVSVMNKFLLATIVGGLLLVQTGTQAQTAPASGKRISSDGNLQTSIVTAIGAEQNTVKVTSSGGVVVVARIGSNMNESTHAGRDNEAKIIGSLVAKDISGAPSFKNVSTIRVEYLARSASAGKGRLVDSVEFRKGPDGAFDFHQT
jgi:hypothetical protein